MGTQRRSNKKPPFIGIIRPFEDIIDIDDITGDLRALIKEKKDHRWSYFLDDLNYDVFYFESYDLNYPNYKCGNLDISIENNPPKFIVKFDELSSLNFILLFSNWLLEIELLEKSINQILFNNIDIVPLLKKWDFYDTHAECYLRSKDDPKFNTWYHMERQVKRSDWGSLLDFFLGKSGIVEINFYQTVEESHKIRHPIIVIGWLHYHVFYMVNSDNDPFDTLNEGLSKCDDFYRSTAVKILNARYKEIKLWESSVKK